MKIYEKFLAQMTQLEAEDGLSEHFEFIQRYARQEGEYQDDFLAANEKYHKTRELLETIFQERLDLNATDSATLFRSYSEHLSDQYEMQVASQQYFEIEPLILACTAENEVANAAFEGLRGCFARNVNAPFQYQGDVGVEGAALKQQVNFQTILANELAEFHGIEQSEAESLVDKFLKLQNLNAKVLIQARIHEGMQ